MGWTCHSIAPGDSRQKHNRKTHIMKTIAVIALDQQMSLEFSRHETIESARRAVGRYIRRNRQSVAGLGYDIRDTVSGRRVEHIEA